MNVLYLLVSSNMPSTISNVIITASEKQRVFLQRSNQTVKVPIEWYYDDVYDEILVKGCLQRCPQRCDGIFIDIYT